MKYIDRTIDLLLSEWRETAKRKPILLRGARQVGKTSSVRHLSEAFEEYIEVNFELDIDVCRVFETVRDPQEIAVSSPQQSMVTKSAGASSIFFPRAISPIFAGSTWTNNASTQGSAPR